MPEIVVKGQTFELNDKEFLKEPEKWDLEVAAALAKLENLDNLTEEHWKVINYIRGYFNTFGIAPLVKRVVKHTGVERERISEIFPRGPANGACRIAGLPEPTGCV